MGAPLWKDSYPGVEESQFYKEDILVGYRWHDTKNIIPSFGFGHMSCLIQLLLRDIHSDKKIFRK